MLVIDLHVTIKFAFIYFYSSLNNLLHHVNMMLMIKKTLMKQLVKIKFMSLRPSWKKPWPRAPAVCHPRRHLSGKNVVNVQGCRLTNVQVYVHNKFASKLGAQYCTYSSAKKIKQSLFYIVNCPFSKRVSHMKNHTTTTNPLKVQITISEIFQMRCFMSFNFDLWFPSVPWGIGSFENCKFW